MKTREDTVKYFGGNPYTDRYEPKFIDSDDLMLLKSKRYEAYIWPNKTSKGWYNCVTFSGKTVKGKPIRLPSFDSAEEHVQSEAEGIVRRARLIEEEKTQRKLYRYNLISSTKPGDILYCSWGWEQTNVDFYQVIDKNKSKFVIRELKQNRDFDASGDAGNASPRPGEFFEDFGITVSVTGHGFKINDTQTAKPLEFKFDESGNRVYDSKPFSRNQ